MQFYYDAARDLLIYPGYIPNVQALPDARMLSADSFWVPRTLASCQVLRYYGYPVPPIMTDESYDWPIEPGRKPLAHQKIYANFFALHRRSFNLGDPGTMKTLSTLWAVDFIMQQYPPGTHRALVIAPLTVLETVWASAIFKNFLSRRSFEILVGPAEKRRALLAKKADISLINHDGLGVGAHTRGRLELDGLSRDIAEREDIKIVVIDEASAYRDARTKRSRLARLIIGNRPYLTMLTGTPVSSAPTDAYGLSKLMSNAFGKSFTSFQMDTMVKVSQFKYVPRADGYEKARRLLQPAVRFALNEIWGGPPSTTQKRMVELTDEQKKLMAELKKDLQIQMKSGALVNATNEAAARQKFMQISLGAIYDSDHKAHYIDASTRYAEIEDIIESTNRKVVVFVPLTSVINRLHKELSKRWKCGIINGDVAAKDRPAIIRAFESEPDFKVMIVDPGAAAHGINEFVVADTAIWMGTTDKTELWIQGNARINRPGQTWPTTIFQLVSNKLEEEIFRRMETNTSLQGALLEAVRKGEL